MLQACSRVTPSHSAAREASHTCLFCSFSHVNLKPAQVQEPAPGPTIPQPQSAQNPSAPTQDPSVQIPKPPQPRPSSRFQLGNLPVPDLQLDEEWMTKWSYRAPPSQHTGPREGFSQSSASLMDLTQEATTAPQQPPSRFRPSNYTVDLSNTTNPPPPQVMVKPAVTLRRYERPEPVSFSVTDAAQLSRTLSEMGSGSGIILTEDLVRPSGHGFTYP